MARQIKVGLFVFLGLALITCGVFLIGNNRHFWEAKVHYVAPFNNVSGLNQGSPVRLGGLEIGAVTDVSYSSDGKDSHVYVRLSVVRKESHRIMKGTVARIVARGLLGDKMVELSVPEGSHDLLESGGTLATEEPGDMFSKIDELSEKAKKTLDNVERATSSFSDPVFAEDLKGTVHDLRLILDGVAQNDSVAHRLLIDPHEGEKVDQALTNLNASSQRLNATLGALQDVTDQVRSGPGIVHAVVYDGDMSKNAAGALEEVHRDLQAIREGNGLAHSLIYGDDNTQHVMGNLNAMSDDLRAIVANVRAGKGTIGGLLVDPTIYEDIRSAVGNVERNQVLRALVRYSIKADEKKPQAAAPPK
jgi:phospholipid/cholesterol/gamma-HCH transport system substrate-binding protein